MLVCNLREKETEEKEVSHARTHIISKKEEILSNCNVTLHVSKYVLQLYIPPLYVKLKESKWVFFCLILNLSLVYIHTSNENVTKTKVIVSGISFSMS